LVVVPLGVGRTEYGSSGNGCYVGNNVFDIRPLTNVRMDLAAGYGEDEGGRGLNFRNKEFPTLSMYLTVRLTP